jgi:putative transcriptional regulator
LLYGADVNSDVRDDELSISDELRLCPSRELLLKISQGQGPLQYHMFLGHSGWGPGQLEMEISQGAWIPARLRLELIFDIPIELRWENALEGEGLHPGQMSASRPQA